MWLVCFLLFQKTLICFKLQRLGLFFTFTNFDISSLGFYCHKDLSNPPISVYLMLRVGRIDMWLTPYRMLFFISVNLENVEYIKRKSFTNAHINYFLTLALTVFACINIKMIAIQNKLYHEN